MPNWKKLIVSGSDATLNSLNVTTTGSFGGDITLTSGSFRIETFTEGFQFYNGSNYTTNRITLTSAQNMQFRTGNAFQFTGGPLQILAGNQLGLKNSANDHIIRIKNTGASGQGKLEIQDHSSNALMAISASGNIGIGTVTPDSLLEISSDSVTDFLKLTSEGSSANPIKLIFEKGASEQGIIEYNRNGDLEIYNSDSDGGVMIDGSTSAGGDLYVANSGNVGIGTTSVEEKLGVNGNIQLPNQQQITWSDFGDGNTGRVAIRGNEDNDTLLFRTDNQVRATLSNSGLDILGSVTSSAQIIASGSQLRAINNAADSVGLTLESPAAGVNVNFDFEVGDTGISNLHAKNLVIRGSSGASDIAFSPSTAYPGLMMLDGSAGRVGIGTTSPLYKLHIKGSTYVNSGTLFIDSGQRLKWGNSNQFIEGTDDTSLEFGTGGSTKLIILDSGNVGINNTSPSKRLVVNGQTQFYEYSGAHLTNNAHSTYNFDTLVSNASATNGGGIGAYVKLAAGATNNSLGEFNAIRTRAYAENTTVNVGGLINFYAEYRNFTSTNSVTLSNHYGLKVDALSVGGNATVTNNYGVYLNPGTTASNNYGVFQVGSAVKNRFAGKVGIGDDPDRALHVKDSSIVTTKFQGQNSAGHLVDLVHDHSDDGYNGLRFFDQTTGRMYLTHIQTGTKGYIQIGNNWASGSEILVVDGDNERVGIGTKAPSYPLHVFAGGSERFGISGDVQVRGSTDLMITGTSRRLSFTAGTGTVRTTTSNNLILQTNSTDALILDTSQNATFKGDVTVDGKLTAQEFHTEFVSASIIYDSGSTKFGDTEDDIHDFTGSVKIFSGSLNLRPNFQNTTGVIKVTHGPYAGSTIAHIVAENTGSQRHFDLITDANNHTDLRIYRAGTQLVQIGTYWPTFINNQGYSTRGGLLVGTGSYTDNYYGLAVAEGGSSGSLNVADTLYVSGSRVGVKTTAPEDELEVFGDFRIRNSNGSNPADAGNLFFAETGGTFGSDAYGFRIHQDGSNNRLHFQGGAAASTVDNILVLERDTGDVGIGITNPSQKLHVNGNILLDGDARHVYFGGTNTFVGENSNSGKLQLRGGGSNTAATTFIDSSGNLGIGTSTPDAKLDVVFGADTSSIARFTGGSNSRELTISSFSVNSLDGAGFKLNATSTSGSIVLQTTTVDRLTVDRDGVVTIGALTSGQTGQLVVNTEGGVPPVAKFMSRTNKAIVQVSDNDTTGFISSENGLFSIGRNGGVNANNININASNKVGIGTSNPGRVLHLYHATENEVLRLESGDGGAYVQFKDNSSDFQPAVGAVGNNLQFRASGSQIAKFDIDGNLRLGSDSGTVRARLHLSGSTAAASGIRQSRSGSKIWAQEIDSNGKLEWKVRSTEGGTATKGLVINDTGQIIFPQYGSGNYTGTAAKTLAVDSSGNIIETDGGGAGTVDGNGVAAQLTFWQDTDTITGSSDTNTNVNVGRLKIGSYVNDYIYLSHYDYGTSTNYALNQGPTGGTSVNAPTGQSVALKINNSAKLTVSSAGYVGIGTTSPASILHINTGTGTGNANSVILDRSGSSDYSAVSFATAGTIDWSIGQNSAGNLEIFEDGLNSKTRVTVETGGNVGIGTDNPGHKLAVIGGNIQTDGIVYSNTIRDNTGGNVVIQDNGGNVGIGTDSPGNILHITKDQSAASSVLKLENKAGANNSGFDIDFQLATSGVSAKIGAIRTNSPGAGDSDIFFSTSTNGTSVTEAMRIKHDGKVGIGTTSMDSLLHISSSTFNNHITLGRDSDKLGITVSGAQVLIEGGVTPFSNDASDLGRSDKHWRNLYITDNIYVSASGDLNLTGSLKISSNLTVANNTTTNLLYTDNIQTRNGTVIDFRHQDASTIMRVDTDDAKVGIGSTSTGAPSPTYKLDVQGSSSNTNIRVLTTTGNAGVRVNTNNSHYVLTGVGSTNQFTIYDSNATEVRFAINSTGKIRFNSYGSATHTGTAAKTLQVDSSGNIIEGAIVNFAPKVEYQALTSDIAANTTFTLPNSLSYTVSSGGYEYLEIFLDGIRLMRGIDFEEISTTQVKTLMAVPSGSVFTYKSIT